MDEPSGTELAALVRALAASEGAIQRVFDEARVGTTPDQMEAIYAAELRRRGIDGKVQGAAFVVGEGGAGPKLRTRVPLKSGDLWGMDMQFAVDGLYADIGRYGVLGEPSRDLMARHTQVLETQQAVADAVRPGETLRRAFERCPAGWTIEVHRIGREIHMAPLFSTVKAGNDLASALDTINLVMRVLGTPVGAPVRRPTFGYDYTHIYNVDNLENVRVVLHDGWVVSSVGIYPNTVRTPRGEISVGGINGVATHPDFRRHGLATAAMTDAHAKMRENGHHIGLLGTGIQDYYRKLGWESAGRQRRFVFDRGNLGFLPEPAGLEVTEDWRPLADELRTLHNAEPIGAQRSPWLFQLLAKRKLGRIFVGRRAGRIVAYAGANGTAVVEYAGRAAEVGALLREAFARLDDPTVRTSERPPGQRATIEMTVATPDAADGLPGLRAALGIP